MRFSFPPFAARDRAGRSPASVGISGGESGKPHAFISYAHEDRAIAHELAFGLQRRGCEVWIDNGELRAGDSLVERLAEGIAEVDFVIAIVSAHSVSSQWCRKELSLAMTQEIDLRGRFGVRRVMPLRVGAVEMPPMLRDKFYLEVNGENTGSIVPRLWEDMVGHTALPAASPAVELSAVERNYEQGRKLYDKGEVELAKRHLHEASQESHHAAALLLGEILYAQNELTKAADEWGFAAGSDDEEVAHAAVIDTGRMIALHEFDPEDRAVCGPLGALIGYRDRDEAERLWRAAAGSEHPDVAWAWIGLGRLLEEGGREGDSQPERAARAYDSAARCGHAESRVYALFKLGRLRWRLGEVDEALALFEVGATSGDREWAPWCAFDLGRIHWERREDEDAGRWWYEAAKAGHPRISESAQEAIDDSDSIWRRR